MDVGWNSSLNGHLRPGETLLWTGRPNVRAFVMRGWWYVVPFSLLWLAFVAYWESLAINANGPILFRLWGVPFILVGLYMLVGRLVLAARDAGNTQYAVTNRRILIQRGAFRTNLTTLDLDRLPGLHFSQHADGRGTITFSANGPLIRPYGVRSRGDGPAPPAFDEIDRAAEVYAIVENARARQQEPTNSGW